MLDKRVLTRSSCIGHLLISARQFVSTNHLFTMLTFKANKSDVKCQCIICVWFFNKFRPLSDICNSCCCSAMRNQVMVNALSSHVRIKSVANRRFVWHLSDFLFTRSHHSTVLVRRVYSQRQGIAFGVWYCLEWEPEQPRCSIVVFWPGIRSIWWPVFICGFGFIMILHQYSRTSIPKTTQAAYSTQQHMELFVSFVLQLSFN